MALRVKRFLTSVNSSNCYICWCDETGHGAVIDPAEFTAEMRDEIKQRGIDIKAIYLTHNHYDHTSAVDEFKRAYGCSVFAGTPSHGSETVTDGRTLELGKVIFRVAFTPGHTDDSICFVTEGAAFVGDALFAAAVGGTVDRTHFEQEVAGVRAKILCLPDEPILYPGHGPATTVGIESCYNPFFILPGCD